MVCPRFFVPGSSLHRALAAAFATGFLAACAAQPGSQTGADSRIALGAHDLGGVVAGANGPEAGVWVIAETRDLPTRFAKIVVTDDRGRYVLPDLPQATYRVWVRGYGLADSAKVTAEPGRIVNLQAIPAATGKHCPEGWTLHRLPGPQFADVKDDGSAEASYYTWVDQFDTFGLGRNVPIATGNRNDSLLALVDGKILNLRVPYPVGFFPKWVEGRIDDAGAGWKGRSLWASYSTRTMYHLEGGKENRPKVVRFQLRPDPLAR